MEDFEIGVYNSGLYYSGKFKEWLELRTKQYNFFQMIIVHDIDLQRHLLKITKTRKR